LGTATWGWSLMHVGYLALWAAAGVFAARLAYRKALVS
jgi:hypothetical protein